VSLDQNPLKSTWRADEVEGIFSNGNELKKGQTIFNALIKKTMAENQRTNCNPTMLFIVHQALES